MTRITQAAALRWSAATSARLWCPRVALGVRRCYTAIRTGTACGNASGNKLNTSVIPFILRGIKLWGVDSIVVSKKRKEFVWGEVPNLIDFKVLEKSIKTVSLNELLDISPSMLKGELKNKILVDVNK